MNLKTILIFFFSIQMVCFNLYAAEEMHNIPDAEGINVHDNAEMAKREEDNAAKKNKSIGTAMMAAGTAMIMAGSAMKPPNMGLIMAGQALMMMGGQAMATGGNMDQASGASGDIGGLVSNESGPGEVNGKDGAGLKSRDLDPKTRGDLEKLSGLGYEFDQDGGFNGPNGSMPNTKVGSEKDLMKNGLDRNMAGKVMAAANKAALAAEKEFSSSAVGKKKKKYVDSEMGDGGDEKSASGAADSLGSVTAFGGGKSRRKTSSDSKVSGKFRKVGGSDRIAVASDNLFFLVKRRYKLKKLQGAFFREKL